MEIVKLKSTKKLAQEHKKFGDEYIDFLVSKPAMMDPFQATREVLQSKEYNNKDLKALVSWQLLGGKGTNKKGRTG